MADDGAFAVDLTAAITALERGEALDEERDDATYCLVQSIGEMREWINDTPNFRPDNWLFNQCIGHTFYLSDDHAALVAAAAFDFARQVRHE